MEKALLAVLTIGILIFVHELGHFILAKLSGIKVEKFSLGFGPELLGFTKGGTRYCLSALPLGGYVKLYGEQPGELDDPDAFYAKSPWIKGKVVFGGPLFNILFAYLIFIVVAMFGVPRLLPKVGNVEKGGPADKAGIKPGDTVISIDGKPVKYWDDISRIIGKSGGRPLKITVKRNGKTLDIKVKPKEITYKDIFGTERKRFIVGIVASGDYELYRMPLIKVPIAAAKEIYYVSYMTVVGIYKLITRSLPASAISGPLMIMKMAGEQAKSGLSSFLNFMAVISVNLGLINLVPIPVLDGWHLLTYAVEAIRGRPISEEKLAFMQKVGIGILLALMTLAFYNDIIHIFFKR